MTETEKLEQRRKDATRMKLQQHKKKREAKPIHPFKKLRLRQLKQKVRL